MDIQRIAQWCVLNKLNLHLSKTKAMVFRSPINVCRVKNMNLDNVRLNVGMILILVLR